MIETNYKKSSKPQDRILDYFYSFFAYDSLAQAEKPQHNPVFPLSSTFVVYTTPTSNTLVTEITSVFSVLPHPRNPHVMHGHSHSSKSTGILALVCLAGLHIWMMTPSSAV